MQQNYPSPNALPQSDAPPFYPQASSHQHPNLSNSDDLQLTAQLSHGLAPIMSAGPGGTMTENQDSRNQDALNHQYDQDSDIHRHQLQPNHGPMDQMGGQYNAPDGSNAPRKRSKVSRACDECRRKKIRCDATGEPGDEQCSSCRRVGARCQFSRVPMKRGPSKGYIKELADRLNHLEGAMQAGELPAPSYMGAQQDNPMQRRASDEFSPPPNPGDNMTRKRTYSSLSGDLNSAFQPPRPSSAWAPQDLARHPANPNPAFSPQQTPSQMFREPDYSPNGMAPTPHWKKGPDPSRRPSNSFEAMLTGEFPQSDRSPGWDDAIIDGYIKVIHPTYPILFASRSRLNSMISACSSTLKDAFFEALHAAVRSFPTSSNQTSASAPASVKKASQLVMASQFENSSSHSTSASIVHLQTVILLAIATENLRWRSQAGLPLSSWLGSAVGLAYSMKLHIYRQQNATSAGDDDTEEKLSRRLWWSLVIMDRWHASSTASPLLIPDGSIVVYPDDQPILGESLYHTARLSVVLGHFAITQTDLPTLSIPSSQVIPTLLRGELERWRESLPTSIMTPTNSPIIHLCYWSTRILLELRRPDSEPHDLLEAAIRLSTLLINNSSLVTPLTYHATILATLTLIEVSGYNATRKEAEEGLKSLLEGRIAPSSCDSNVRDLINKKLRSLASTSNPLEGQHDATSSQNLQRLADLATATEGIMDATAGEGRKQADNSNSTTPIDSSSARYQNLRKMIREGYITAILSTDLTQ
ncbi:hypothetical protein B0J14DRAFT_649874 [Halenospora varia]|nr:hypothetical protein B0J14DRAFT_649874 [Halenospora varia]